MSEKVFVNMNFCDFKVYTGGTFDLFHDGHVELLWYCRLFAGASGQVIVALNTDEFVERYKGERPVLNYKQRATILKATSYVDVVIPNEGDEDSKPAILKARPDLIVIGMDWLEKDYCKQMGFTPQWLTDNKISLAYVPRTSGESTTSIKRRVV